MKRNLLSLSLCVIACLSLAAGVGAAELIVYPAKGQSAEQTAKDRTECRTWATQQTSFDPVNPPTPPVAAPPPSTEPDGRRVRGAARGAAVGAIGGAVAGDAGKGAGAGAAAGAVVAGMKRRDQVRQAHAENEEALRAHQQKVAELRTGWDRALGACLEGRGYTVK